MSKKIRIDIYLVNKKMVSTIKEAQALIYANKVHSSSIKFSNPSELVKEDEEIYLTSNSNFVSRAGEKLQDLVNEEKDLFIDKVVVDIGSSTGGFVHCCLKNGAIKVYAIDVGTNQLHYDIRKDQRVVSLENTDFRNLTADMFSEKIDIVCCDLAFISSIKVFSKLKQILTYPFTLIILIKPQFEVSKEIASENKGYIDYKYHEDVIECFKREAEINGYKLSSIKECTIKGKIKSNTEYISKWVKE